MTRQKPAAYQDQDQMMTSSDQDHIALRSILLVAVEWAKLARYIANVFRTNSYILLNHETTHSKKCPGKMPVLKAKIFCGNRESVTLS